MFKLKLNILVIFLTLLIANSVFAKDWKLIKSKDNISIYKKDLENSSLVSFRGVGIVDAPYARVLQVILDPKRAETWGKDLKESKVLKWINKPLEFVEYNEIELPIFLSNRDFVSKIKIEINKAQKFIKVNYIIDNNYKHPIKEENVLGDITGSYFIVSPVGNRTKLEGVAMVDPKGLIPHWVVNLFQANWAYDTILSIKEQLKRDDGLNHPYFYKILD